MDCTQDCQRRRVGCRKDCPDWAEHERLKAERYAATARKYAAQPSEALKERNLRRKLRKGLKR